MTTPLCPAELIFLSGADAVAFAHAQFTSDVAALPTGAWQWSAWLDPQGRARAFVAVLRIEPERLLLWLPLGGAAAMRDALARFVLRAKVQVEAASDWTLHALEPGDTALPAADAVVAHMGGYAFLQPGEPARIAWLAHVEGAAANPDELARWRRADIAARLPLLAPELASEFVAQALDLERLDAIRFDKGCYPGQEIVARLHFRGGNKRHPHRVRVDGAPLACATPIVDGDGGGVGRILYATTGANAGTSEALAVLIDESGERTLRTAEGTFIHCFNS
jgi:folate-binding protein YgfZ